MFSKASKIVTKSPFYVQKRGIRQLFLDYFRAFDNKSPNYRAASYNPLLPLEGHQPVLRETTQPKFETTKLKNGITVVTETAAFPNVVDLGILLDVGTRDETAETSGALLNIKNTYYKTVLNTNEAVNYGMVQMSGGDYFMDYDQENAYFHGYCLSHDVVDIFNMIADCAIEPRSATAASVGQAKGNETHKLEEYLQTGQVFNDLLMQVAFGNTGLGMPLLGHKGNIEYLNSHVLQKFQLDNITPNRIYVCAGGVENHQEFVDLVEGKLGFIPSADSASVSKRQKSAYVGGEVKNTTDKNEITIAVAFEGAAWKDTNMVAYNVLSTLLGQSREYNPRCAGRGNQSRVIQRLLNKLPSVDSANAINFHFSDTGLFGLVVTGSAANPTELLTAITTEIRDLTKSIPAEELQRAKNTLKANILLAMERQTDRIEEAVKNAKIFGNVHIDRYLSEVDKVTGEQINKIVADLVTKTPTLIARGGNAHTLPSIDKLQNQLKL